MKTLTGLMIANSFEVLSLHPRLATAMTFENYQKTSSLNVANSNWYSGKGEFVRKGVVGDWVNYFTDELTKEYDSWIVDQLDTIGIDDKKVRGYFCLYE